MYSILLVDDETTVRNMIRTSIDWERYGFSIIDEAENGIEALDIIHERNPDVLITDIRMPYMDGISLITEMRKTNTTTTIIILSGYDEFSYAQSAIQLDVAYYALKPLSKEDFIKLLVKIRLHLDKKIENITNRKRLEEAYQNAVTNLTQQLLTEIYEGKTKDILSKAVSYNFPCEQDFYMTAVIELQEKNIEFALVEVEQVLNSCLADDKSFFYTIFKNNNIITFYHKIKTDKKLEEALFIKRTLNKVNDINKSISFYTKLECNIGVSRPVYNFMDLAEARHQGISALNYKPYYPQYSIYYIGDLESANLTFLSTQSMEEGLDRLVSEIKFGNKQSIEKAINELFNKKNGLDPEHIQTSLFKMVTILAELACGYDIAVPEFKKEWASLTSVLVDTGTIRTISTQLKDLCFLLNDEVEKKRKISSKKFVEDAKKQIEFNYNNPDFSLEVISSFLGVSESYFSTTFKKECGVAFVKYLNSTRIENAKKLLKNKELKTYEVAELVGFSDPNYFSFCFKKKEGISPQTYRKTKISL